MLALVKASLLLGAVLLIGAGVFGRFVAPELREEVRTPLRWGVLTGAAVLLIGSAVDVTKTVNNALGRHDAAFLLEYMRFTRHGNAVLVRLGLVVVVAFFTLRWAAPNTAPSFARRTNHALYLVSSLGLLATFSWTSHAATMGGTPPLLADLAHFAAASAWSGAVLYLALAPVWGEGQRTKLNRALARVSALGLACVALLFVTGGYTSLIHLQNPERFAQSPYGQALIYKLLLVAVIVGLAAYNQLWLLPASLKGKLTRRFRRVMRLEALTLVAVFITTGVLTTSAVPHEPGVQPTALENLTTLLRYLGAFLKGA